MFPPKWFGHVISMRKIIFLIFLQMEYYINKIYNRNKNDMQTKPIQKYQQYDLKMIHKYSMQKWYTNTQCKDETRIFNAKMRHEYSMQTWYCVLVKLLYFC